MKIIVEMPTLPERRMKLVDVPRGNLVRLAHIPFETALADRDGEGFFWVIAKVVKNDGVCTGVEVTDVDFMRGVQQYHPDARVVVHEFELRVHR